jgi:hypothetical protein
VTTASGAGSALTVKGGNATGTNQNGSYVLIGAGLGTGSGVSGDLLFQTAPAGSSGTTQNTPASVMTITSAGDVLVPASNAQILGPASGSAAAGAVSYSFSGDTDTGFFRSEANVFHAATGGVTRMTIDGDGLDVAGNVIYNLERETQTGTAYTFVAGDRGKYVTMNNASAQTVTVPPNSGVAFDIGTQIQVIGLGAGEITMVAGSGVTLRYTPGLKLRAQYSSCTCIKIATDEWILIGDLEA